MYFDKCKTIEELKKEFHRLALIHHPDKGGDVTIMQSINTEYEARLRYLSDNPGDNVSNGYNPDDEYEVGERYRKVINRIINLPNISIEICGRWIWISGETYVVRDQLKAAGFWWASQKKKWYWRPPEQNYKRTQSKSMEWIRGTYGTIPVNRPAILEIGG